MREAVVLCSRESLRQNNLVKNAAYAKLPEGRLFPKEQESKKVKYNEWYQQFNFFKRNKLIVRKLTQRNEAQHK